MSTHRIQETESKNNSFLILQIICSGSTPGGLFILHYANANMKGQKNNYENYPHTVDMRRQYAESCISNLPQSMKRQIWHFLSLPSHKY